MKVFRLVWVLSAFFIFHYSVVAQEATDQVKIEVKDGVAWWSGISNHGQLMPLQNGYVADLNDNYGNQVQSLMLSSAGEVVWSEEPFKISLSNNQLMVESSSSTIIYKKVGKTLKEAFLYASENWFPATGQMPDELLFSAPQYNTWIELMYDQNEEDIYEYANQIIKNGFPPGVLMIDDNWQQDYGKWDFKATRFTNPKKMMDSLHQMGFKVMLWVCPMVSPDSEEYRYLASKDLLLMEESGLPAIVRWWNGASGILDLSKQGAADWFKEQLDYLQNTYGVDGFKFDAGDFEHYVNCYSGEDPASPQQQCKAYAEIGLDYPLNEYRAMWQMAGQPIVNRLRDKAHNWEDLIKLVPDILVQGLSGYNFTCPDMIGGGEFSSFLGDSKIDQELIVRSAQCHALMPMMQFSVAPWRILDDSHFDACMDAVKIRDSFTELIMQLAKESAESGEPIVRTMDYVYPNQGFQKITDQFLLGDKLLVAPVQEQGITKHEVNLPSGKWKAFNGKIYKGGKKVIVDVTLETLPYFTLIENK
ncbi:MAG: glycoside hydrolase [Rickettsiales bacterium]|nr:glycoside hydrolase [Rickettsiales bacterium]